MPGQLIPVEHAGPTAPGPTRPTYAWLASLPTDPVTLLDTLRGLVTAEEGESADQAVFHWTGDLLSTTLMPPENAAAFYRAVERIPGVTTEPDATDALGRHGIGVTRDDPASATRDEWIFDPDTLEFLGSRSYFTHASGKSGTTDTLFGTDAIVRHAVTDEKGTTPGGSGTARG
jgi:hypothetical protein